MVPFCPTAQRRLQGQHSRKTEQLCPRLPEGAHVHHEHSLHFLGCCCWINNLGCPRSAITEQNTPETQGQSPCVCLLQWGWTGAGHKAAAEHTASAGETENLWTVDLAALPYGMFPAQEWARNIPSHVEEEWITTISDSRDH